MYLAGELLRTAERRWGAPRRFTFEAEISPTERELIRRTRRGTRAHDVTLFIEHAGRYAVIAKHQYPAGGWRAPGGGINEGEELEAGALREGFEETGLAITLERYLLHIDARFACGALEAEPWHTEVFLARSASAALAPRDTHEIAAARWATRDELQGPIRDVLLSTGRPLFGYRVALTDWAFAQMDVPLL
ncbi:MAG: NUDIX hydrolase [Chloroflexi bacterium]|nr:NUDIX hydrolase [Chloroflexota bacterium]